MSSPDSAASGIASLDTSIAIARHRRDVPSVRGVLLSPATAERSRLQEILRRAGHSIQATDDHEDALDLVVDARPSLVAIAVDSDGNAVNTVKMIKVLTAGWAHDTKIIAIGEGAHEGSVDAVVASVPHEDQLLGAVESLFRKAPTQVAALEETRPVTHAHLRDVAQGFGMEFVEDYVADSFRDIEVQLNALEAEIFRKNSRNVVASLQAIQGLALNVDDDHMASLCRQWRIEPADALIDALPHIIQTIRHTLPHARTNASQIMAALSQFASRPET
ncbi:hypothetical protein [Lysobacter tyrosinilyticus]